jgi:hypothetical protein
MAWKYWATGGIPNMPGTTLPLWYFFGSWTPGDANGADWPSTPASSSLFVAEAAVAQASEQHSHTDKRSCSGHFPSTQDIHTCAPKHSHANTHANALLSYHLFNTHTHTHTHARTHARTHAH